MPGHDQHTPSQTRAEMIPRALLNKAQWRSIRKRMHLSGREFDIVQSIFDGMKESAIARELGISPHTVHSHVKRLYRKLDVADHAELIVRVFAAYVALDADIEQESV